MKIVDLCAREILDSRGNPTVSVLCELEDGVMAEASVPSGASTGSEEALELRDGGKRYLGMGVLSAIENVNVGILRNIRGIDFKNQAQLDNFLCNLDGTKNKEKYGANALLPVSMSFARAMSISESKELFEYLAENYWNKIPKSPKIPTPMFNILNGGKHAGNNIDVQETMIVPIGVKGFKEKLRVGSEIYHYLKNMLLNAGFDAGLGDEGGFAPDFSSNDEVFKTAQKAIFNSGYSKEKVRISVDIAANSFYDDQNDLYYLSADEKHLDSKKMIKNIANWTKKYDFYSVEDGLSEKDPNWKDLTAKIAPAFCIGDDLFVTNAEKIRLGAEEKIANGVIIKLNQIGTVTEAFDAIRQAQEKGMKTIVSHRSGETEDSFIADFAVAVSADLIKSGAPARSERLAKYNRLLRIEEILKQYN